MDTLFLLFFIPSGKSALQAHHLSSFNSAPTLWLQCPHDRIQKPPQSLYLKWPSLGEMAESKEIAGRDGLPQEQQPPTKKTTWSDYSHLSNRSLGFWNSLDKAHLTRTALSEIDQRNALKPRPPPAVGVAPADIARFARHGGPDLCHLRGVRKAYPCQNLWTVPY